MPDNSLKLQIANLALSRIGVRPIAGFSESSTEARRALEVIEHVLRATLRDHPWPFATKYADPLELVDGSTTEPVNRDWVYAYAYPSDCLFVRRILVDTGRKFYANPVPYRVGREGDQLVVYTDLEDAGIEYTAIFDCPVQLADELFISGCAWRMAAELAPTMARNKLTAAEATRQYVIGINRAAAVGSREQQQEAAGEAEWIRER